MSDPLKPPMPEGKKTVDLPAVTDRALLEDLTRSVREGFRMTNANIEVVANDLGVVKARVDILESERTKLSGGVRQLSSADADGAAQLAQERMAREALAVEVADLKKTNETQLAILARLDKVASNPMVKTVVTILVTILGTWAASKGIAIK